MMYWLMDTGPLVAYLDRGDPAHAQVAAILDEFSGVLATTNAVITEAMHFVSVDPRGAQRLAEFAASSGMQVYDLCQPRELKTASNLMNRYSDTPMDFADATLVLLGEALEVFEIVTLDRRGFSTYRARGNKHFRLVLDHHHRGVS